MEVEQIGIGCCCLILYIIALAEYTESERTKIVGREGVVVSEYRRRCRVVVADADADADADVGVVIEFDSCYLVGYCDV